jgi:hypothetical protein
MEPDLAVDVDALNEKRGAEVNWIFAEHESRGRAKGNLCD